MTQKPNKKSHVVSSEASPKPTLRAQISRNKGWVAAGVAAVALAGTALLNRAHAKSAEAAAPPAGKFMKVDGVRLHYVDRGHGPAVVLLHGNGVMLQDFEASGVLGLAAEHNRVIAFDRPGFGYSDRPRTTVWTPAAQAELIARALRKIDVERAVVVGHSWGTLVALAMALEHPAMVEGLVLMSGYYYGTARPDVLPASLPAIPVVGDVLAHTVAPLTGLLTGPVAIKASFAPAPISGKIANLPKAMTLRPSQVRATAADAALMVFAAMKLSHRYRELSLPVIVMAGGGDLIVHVDKHAERLVGEVTGAELRVVHGQGHLFHYAVPEQVVAAVQDVRQRAA